MDLFSMVGKDIHVTLYRQHRYKEYTGRLINIHCSSICLSIDNKSVWISKPIRYHDSIKEVKK